MRYETDRGVLSSSAGQSVRFTPQQALIFEAIARHGPNRTALLDSLRAKFRDHVVDEVSSLRVVVWAIRQKLKKHGFALEIRSDSGFGYRISAEIDLSEANPNVTLPGAMVQKLRDLLWSHPDHAAADKILQIIGV